MFYFWMKKLCSLLISGNTTSSVQQYQFLIILNFGGVMLTTPLWKNIYGSIHSSICLSIGKNFKTTTFLYSPYLKYTKKKWALHKYFEKCWKSVWSKNLIVSMSSSFAIFMYHLATNPVPYSPIVCKKRRSYKNWLVKIFRSAPSKPRCKCTTEISQI